MMSIVFFVVLGFGFALMRMVESARRRTQGHLGRVSLVLCLTCVCSAAGADVMIAAGGASHLALDFHAPTGNFFTVVQLGSDWSLYMSTDRGKSWTETYDYDAIFFTGTDIDMQVHGDHVYVATSFANSLAGTSAASIRRFSAATGALDESWGSHTVLSVNDRSIEEVALVVVDSGSIFVGLLYSTDNIMLRVGHVNTPTVWGGKNPQISNAELGLDMDYPGSDSNHFLAMTYVGNDGGLYLLRLNDSWYFSDLEIITWNDGVDKSSVAAGADDVVITYSFKDPASPHPGVKALHGHGMAYAAMDWQVWPAWESDTMAYHDPLVAMGDGSSKAIVYEQEGDIILRHDWGFDAAWSPASSVVNEHDFVLGDGDTFAFAWLGSGYGLVYPAAGGGVYFCLAVFLADGFEDGSLGSWSAVQ